MVSLGRSSLHCLCQKKKKGGKEGKEKTSTGRSKTRGERANCISPCMSLLYPIPSVSPHIFCLSVSYFIRNLAFPGFSFTLSFLIFLSFYSAIFPSFFLSFFFLSFFISSASESLSFPSPAMHSYRIHQQASNREPLGEGYEGFDGLPARPAVVRADTVELEQALLPDKTLTVYLETYKGEKHLVWKNS